jgi:hypothetical protein
VDVLIFVTQAIALIAVIVGTILIEDTGLQIFIAGLLVMALSLAVEARRSA